MASEFNGCVDYEKLGQSRDVVHLLNEQLQEEKLNNDIVELETKLIDIGYNHDNCFFDVFDITNAMRDVIEKGKRKVNNLDTALVKTIDSFKKAEEDIFTSEADFIDLVGMIFKEFSIGSFTADFNDSFNFTTSSTEFKEKMATSIKEKTNIKAHIANSYPNSYKSVMDWEQCLIDKYLKQGYGASIAAKKSAFEMVKWRISKVLGQTGVLAEAVTGLGIEVDSLVAATDRGIKYANLVEEYKSKYGLANGDAQDLAKADIEYNNASKDNFLNLAKEKYVDFEKLKEEKGINLANPEFIDNDYNENMINHNDFWDIQDNEYIDDLVVDIEKEAADDLLIETINKEINPPIRDISIVADDDTEILEEIEDLILPVGAGALSTIGAIEVGTKLIADKKEKDEIEELDDYQEDYDNIDDDVYVRDELNQDFELVEDNFDDELDFEFDDFFE